MKYDFVYLLYNLAGSHKQNVFLLPVSKMALVPFMSGKGIALPPHVGFDLASKLVRYTTAGSLHGTEGVGGGKEEAPKRTDEEEGLTLKPLLALLDVCALFLV